MNENQAPVLPGDNMAYRFPVSVKAIVTLHDQVLLLFNERNEWELPGGKLELGETPELCVAREVQEELGLNVEIGNLIDAWVYHIAEGVDVLILTYPSIVLNPDEQVRMSNEHKEWRLFSLDDITTLTMPEGYKQSLAKWIKFRSTPVSEVTK